MRRSQGRAAPRRRVAAGLVGVAVLAASCSAGGDGGGGGDGGDVRILRYGYDMAAQFTNTFDVALSKGDCDVPVLNLIYDTLVHKAPGNRLEPGLAESWRVLDESTFEITLRAGLLFHDGTPLDAAAVQRGLERNATNSQISNVALIEKFEVVDDRTLRMTLSKPIAPQFPYGFTGRDGMVMADASTSEAPVGAGPMRLESYEPGARIALRRYDGYWDEDAYRGLDGIDFVQTGTGAPAVAALRAGDLDLIRIEAESHAGLAQDDERYGIAVQPTGAYLQFEFRLGDTPFADKRVRQAVAHAIDRERVNEVVMAGLGEVATQPFPQDSPVYLADLAGRYPYDPQEARDLLAEAGYPDGFDFVLVIPGGNIASMESQAVELQQMLEEVGLRAEIQRILGTDIATQYYIKGLGDAFAAAEMDTSFPPGKLYNNYGNFQFVAIYSQAERDDITDLMIRAQGVTDVEETYELVRQAVRIAVEEALDVPIAFMPQFLAYDKERVGGTVRAQTNICDAADLSGVELKP